MTLLAIIAGIYIYFTNVRNLQSITKIVIIAGAVSLESYFAVIVSLIL